MKKILLLTMIVIPGLLPGLLWSQVSNFPYSEGFEDEFQMENMDFISNWSGSHVDGIRIFQEDEFTKDGAYSLGLWPVVEEGEDEEEVEVFAQVKLDLSGMENVAARFWVATRATGAMKHVKLYMQASIDGGESFGTKILMGSDHRGFTNEDSDFSEFVYALHPETFDKTDVVLRFLAKAGARKGTAAKILIDDVYVYAAESDIFPPIALEPRPVSINEINIEFSEPVSSTALDISNYSLNSVPIEGEAEISTEGDVVILHLDTPILIGKYYELGIANIEDLAGNVMEPTTSDIIYNPLQEGLVITEILYDEPPAEQKDDLEFIELYNATDEPIELGGLKIKGGITSGALPEYTLEPGKFWITAKDAAAFTDFFGVPAYEWHGANLSNDEPETIYIINTDHHSEVRIDLVTYEVGAPWPEGAAGGGYSMVLCDPSLDNSNPENWSNATQYAGTYKGYEIYASPGKGCCTSEIIVDAGKDKVVYRNLPEKFGCTGLTVAVSGGVLPYTYSWTSLPDASGPEVEVCPEITTTYTVTVTDAYGCKGYDEVTVFVKDLSNNEKMTLCYKDKTLIVAPAAAKKFLEKGATVGACEETSENIDALEAIQDISIYPNPASEVVNISFTSLVETAASAEIFNFNGQRMTALFEGQTLAELKHSFKIDTGNWPNGLYVVVIKTGGKTYSKKFVKQK